MEFGIPNASLTATPVLVLIGLVLATRPFGWRGDRFLCPVGVALGVLVQPLLSASSVSRLVTLIAAATHIWVSGATLTHVGPALESNALGSLLGLPTHWMPGAAALVTVAAMWL